MLGTLTDFENQEGLSICFLPSVDMSARAIAIVKLNNELLFYIVDCLGASTKNKVAYYIRYVVLALISVLCITICFHKPSTYPFNSEGFLVW